MRKITALILTAFLLSSCLMIASSARLFDASITAVKGTPLVDGQLDSAWDKDECQPVDNWLSEDDQFSLYETKTTGTVRTLWDEDFFYVFVEVDKAGTDVYPGDESWSSLSNTDNVLINVSQKVTEGSEDVANGGNPDAGCFRVTAGGLTNGLGEMYAEVSDKYVAAASITASDKYVCEYAIPWNNFTPADGLQILLEVQINVNTVGDDARYTVIEWGENDKCLAWNNSKCMSIVNLAAAPALEIVEEAASEAPAADVSAADVSVSAVETTQTAPATFDGIGLAVMAALVCGAAVIIGKKR